MNILVAGKTGSVILMQNREPVPVLLPCGYVEYLYSQGMIELYRALGVCNQEEIAEYIEVDAANLTCDYCETVKHFEGISDKVFLETWLQFDYKDCSVMKNYIEKRIDGLTC